MLFSDTSEFYFKLNPGYFAVFFPGDAHAVFPPDKYVKKAIVKIRLTL